MNRHRDDRRRYREDGPGGRSFEGERDVGQRHARNRDADELTGDYQGAGRQYGFEDERTRPGYYGQRPYAARQPDYDYDPRGPAEYSYSGARGSSVSPGWDRWRGDMRQGSAHGEFGHGRYEEPAYGREAGYAMEAPPGFGRGGARYAGADYGRGFQTPGRGHFDSDDLESRQRMQRWSGQRGAGQYEVYGPYGGGERLDEGRSGYRSSWGASREQLGHGQTWRGHGPQGYARSDERITEDICERLTDDPDVDPRDVRVQVQEGVVTLEGRVDDRWMKHHIEDLVDATYGVSDIHNRIAVGPRNAEPGTAGDTLQANPGDGSPSRH